MAEKTTFVKVDRNITRWQWYTEANTYRVFTHLLYTVNWNEGDFMGVHVSRGERVTSYGTLAKELKLSVKNVRTAIEHLKSTGEVASRNYSKFQVLSVVNFDSYQSQAGKTAGNWQADGRQAAGKWQQSKKYKNNKEEKEAAGPIPLDADGPPPKGTPEWDRWHNQ